MLRESKQFQPHRNSCSFVVGLEESHEIQTEGPEGLSTGALSSNQSPQVCFPQTFSFIKLQSILLEIEEI